jgi:flagellar motor protein MotB
MLGRRGTDREEEPEMPPSPAVTATVTEPEQDQPDTTQDMIDETSDMEFDLPPVALANGKTDSSLQAGTIKWPTLKIDHAKVTQDGDISCTIVFDNGIFTSMTNLSETASDILLGVAHQTRASMSEFNMIIKGHTDSTPVKSKSSSLDNYALAMARARIVRDIMVTTHRFPDDAVFTVSAGEHDPPYSNDTEESRRKNRTVVLKLVPRQ